MNKRQFIRKLAMPAVITAGISIIVLLAMIPVDNAQTNNYKDGLNKKKEELRSHIASSIDRNQKYLQSIADRIKSSRPDRVLINNLQAEFLAERQKPDQPRRYLWMSSVDGDFLFGVPNADFKAFNNAFDQRKNRSASSIRDEIEGLKSQLSIEEQEKEEARLKRLINSPQGIRPQQQSLIMRIMNKRARLKSEIARLEKLDREKSLKPGHSIISEKKQKSAQERNDYIKTAIYNADIIPASEFGLKKWDDHSAYLLGLNLQGNDANPRLMVNSLEAAVYDGSGKQIAQLFLEIDDRANTAKYYNFADIDNSINLKTIYIIFVPLLVASGIFLWFLLPTWVYIDAKDRDVKNPLLWAFIALISLLVGLAIYLITRPDTLKSFECPECGGELDQAGVYCPLCGKDLSKAFCQQCQYPLRPEWKYCPNCRTEVGNDELLLDETGKEIPLNI